MALTAGLGVAQLVVFVGGLVLKIKQAADKAKQNKRDCEHLVLHLSNIDETLCGLPQDPEVARLLVQLSSTLEEAHVLVVACQKSGIFKVKKLFHASSDANKFKEMKDRITSHLNLFPMASHSALARRLDQMILHVQQARMAQGSSSSSSVQTQMVVPHVGTVSDDQPRSLTWAEVQAATGNLAYVLGEGFSGKVYEGRLHHGGRVREVAVKVLHKHGRQSMEDASMAELETLFPIRHNHIARLVGWCWEWERPMFVYEHMGNGTLRDHLLGLRGSSPVESSWKARVEVLLGVSRALLHLHCFATPPVIHRNVSSSNILLDASWTSHLSDFGTAVLRAAGEEYHGQGQPVEEVVGTFGYIDPEYSRTKHVSPASDVYSFGVVMLEVLTGMPPVRSASSGSSSGKVTLVSSAFPVIQNGDLQNVLDGRRALVTTSQHFRALELVANTALLCLLEQGKDRLAMSVVVANLEEALEIIRSDET